MSLQSKTWLVLNLVLNDSYNCFFKSNRSLISFFGGKIMVIFLVVITYSDEFNLDAKLSNDLTKLTFHF